MKVDNLIYPIIYHYRGRWGSDKDFILKRMAHIPPDKQQEVSDEYERLYTKEGRKSANTYLHELARGYQKERSPDAYNRHLEKMKGMVKQPEQKNKPTSSGVVNNKPLPNGMKGIKLD